MDPPLDASIRVLDAGRRQGEARGLQGGGGGDDCPLFLARLKVTRFITSRK